MKSTFSSFAFGCRVNQAEREEIDRQLMLLGYRYDSQNPQIHIVNSCAVTNKAEREARQHINQIKKKFPGIKIVVTGCAATNWLKQGLSIENVDILVDNTNKEYLASLISKKTNETKTLSLYRQPQKYEDKYMGSGRLLIKIQDGCHRFCTFCIVPYLRGLPKSVPMDAIIHKINSCGAGLKEVILTAINTEAYGKDKKESFLGLLTAILDQTSVSRVSFGSIHPWSITQEFFDFYGNHPQTDRIVNFFHIPLQSGSDKILALMKRDYKRKEFIERLETLNKIKPFTFIGTDIIVGFLEENDKDFQDTYDFLEKSPITKFHIFRYSQRQHTAAFYMSKRLREPSPEDKMKRAKALADLTRRKYGEFLQKHINNDFDALFLEKREGEYQHVVLNNQIPAIVKTSENMVGQIRKIKITAFEKEKLLGKIL
jgi:threonylcarbamoyladenosine tRNA methylthiotransferase MtaB